MKQLRPEERALADPPIDSISVTIAVLTYKRPDALAEALPLLLEQAAAARAAFQVGVLVVDNHASASAFPVAARFSSRDVRYTVEPARGISAARNRALAEAGTKLLIFIDDDELPHAGWLKELLECWRAHNAIAVAGRVVSEWRSPVDPWIDAGGFFERRRLRTGSRIETAATNNLLLDLEWVRSQGLEFSHEFGLTGGGDTLFTRSLARRGGRMVWCDEAAVTDLVPTSRATRQWVLSRSARYGNSSVRVDLALAEGPRGRSRARASGLFRGVARVAIGGCRWALGRLLHSQRHEARGLRTGARGRGMVLGAFGLAYHEYSGEGWRRRLSQR